MPTTSYELFATTDAIMAAALKNIGIFGGRGQITEGRLGNIVWALNYYGTKRVDAGTTFLNSKNQITSNVNIQTGVYANLLWVTPTAIFTPPVTGNAATIGIPPINANMLWS